MMANLHPYITVWFQSTMRIPNTMHTSRPWRLHERTRTGDLHRFRTETMKITTLLDEVLPRLVVNVFSGWL